MRNAPRQQPEHRALPAYGRELLDLRRRGLVPECHVFFGDVLVVLDDWKAGTAIRLYRMVIAKDHDPALLEFSMVAGLDVIIAYKPSVTMCERRDAALRQILRAEPASLRVIDLEAPSLGFWIKSRKHGLEMPEYA